MSSEFGFGTLVTNLSNYMGTGHSVRQQERDEQQNDYLARERLGIQARIEGAKAAGIHPLVAMGFQAGPGPTQVLGGVREASNIGLENFSSSSPSSSSKPPPPTEVETQMQQAQLRRANAEADLVEIQAHNASMALATQPGQGVGTLEGPAQTSALTSPYNLTRNNDKSLLPGIKIKPDEVTAGRGGLNAGTHQAGDSIELPDGSRWRIPSGKASEGLEDMDLAKYYLFWQLNKNQLIDWAKSTGRTYSQAVQDAFSGKGRFAPKTRQSRRPGSTGSW